jgi:hypothetical protein
MNWSYRPSRNNWLRRLFGAIWWPQRPSCWAHGPTPSAAREKSLQDLERIGTAILIAVENCHARCESYQEQAASDQEEPPNEENAKQDNNGSPLAERGEDGGPFCGDHLDA